MKSCVYYGNSYKQEVEDYLRDIYDPEERECEHNADKEGDEATDVESAQPSIEVNFCIPSLLEETRLAHGIKWGILETVISDLADDTLHRLLVI